jgi:hypothetical protein
MRSSVAILAGLTVVLLAGSVQAAPAFIGKWNVVAEERNGERRETPPERKLIVEFQKSGKLVMIKIRKGEGGEKTKTREGTWKLSGKTIVTVFEGKTEEMTFELIGKKMKLSNPKRPGQHMHLERAH